MLHTYPQSHRMIIIEVIGFDLICTSIINEVKTAMFYSVLADEVSGHNVEHLALCLRFVDDKCDVQEKFVGFVKLQRVRANDIANAIVTTLEDDLKLSLVHLLGQGYDEAANMSGQKSSFKS